MNAAEVQIEVRTTAAQWWLRLCRVLRFVVGNRRACRWGIRGAWRLSKWRLGNGPWQPMDPDLMPEPTGIGPVPEKTSES